MAIDLFLSVDKPYNANSTDSTTQTQVYSFNFGVSNSAKVGTGSTGAGGAGKPTFSDLSVSLGDGDASTGLLESALTGKQHTYYLSLKKTGAASSAPYEVFQLSNGIVSSFQESGGSDGPVDSVSIAFSKISRTLTSQKADGTSGTPATTTYDLTTNKVSAAKVAAPLAADLSTPAPASPANETFTFHSGSAQEIAKVLESKRCQAAVSEIRQDFSSLASVIAAAHPSSDGHSTILDLPNGSTITLAGLSEKQIKADAKQVGHLMFG